MQFRFYFVISLATSNCNLDKLGKERISMLFLKKNKTKQNLGNIQLL